MRNIVSLMAGVSMALAAFPSSARNEPRVIDVEAGAFYMVSGVNVRNGNFAVTYKTSNYQDDPSGVPFDRVYNSKSTYQGQFGLGWGSPMETRLLQMRDGTVMTHENGTGNYTVYGPIRTAETESAQGGDPGVRKYLQDLEQGYQTMKSIHWMEKRIKEKDPSVSEETLKNIRESKDARFEAMLKYKLYEPVEEGAKFSAAGYSTFADDPCLPESSIQRQQGSKFIERIYPDSCRKDGETFDLDGNLVQLKMRGANEKASLKMQRKGPVITQVTDEKGKTTKFFYDDRHRLTRQVYPDSVWQEFAYDDRGNMTSITYIDHSKQLMTYDKEDRATSVTKRNGDTTTFEYLKDPYDPSVSLTRAMTTVDGKKEVVIFRFTD